MTAPSGRVADDLPSSSESPLGMPAPSVIIHERVANWSRQLRPRFQGCPIRWSETRSSTPLVRAASRSACPVLVIGLDHRAERGLRDFDEALLVAPNALSLVLDPLARDEVAWIARELGATLVLTGAVVPPEVERLLHRWLPIVRKRSESEGWSADLEPEPEPWEIPDPFDWPRSTDPKLDEAD